MGKKREKSWVGGCSAHLLHCHQPGKSGGGGPLRPVAPFRGGFSSCLINYPGPASGRDHERQREERICLGCQNSLGHSMLRFAALFTVSPVSQKARWGSLGWLLNLRLRLLSSHFPCWGFWSAATWTAARVDGRTPVSQWAQGLGGAG